MRFPTTKQVVAFGSWLYGCSVLTVLALFAFVGEAWWPVSLLLFCPRWLFLLPLLPLGLATARVKCRSLGLAQAALALVVVGPLMRSNVPLGAVAQPSHGEIRIRILTLNQHNGTFRPPELIDLIEREKIDLLCFQEMIFAAPLEHYLSRGWFRDHSRCIASRFPITEEYDPLIVPFDDPAYVRARIRVAPGVDVVVASVHWPTIRTLVYSLLKRDARGV